MSLTLVRHGLLEQQKTFKDKTGSSDGKQFHQIQQTNKPLLITIH
jgi:hypothetical protein